MTKQRLTVVSAQGPLNGWVRVPPSKSYTHRAVLMASLAGGDSTVWNPLLSRDTKATIAACRAMGATIKEQGSTLQITGTSGVVKTPEDIVNVENSGTTLRFMTSVFGAAKEGDTVLTGDESIRKRPMQPLLDTLKQLGVEAWSTRKNGCAPIVVKGGGLKGGEATIKGDVSSQFISSLLISAPMAEKDTILRVSDAVSRPYIDATLTLSKAFGVNVEREDYTKFKVLAGQKYQPARFTVPADFSSASFIIAAIAMMGGKVELDQLNMELPQGDSKIIKMVAGMGVRIRLRGQVVEVEHDGKKLPGGTFNLGDTPDLLPVMAVLALRSTAPIEIIGTGHARFKETDRIAIMAQELSKLGLRIEERPDGMKVYPSEQLKPAVLDAHDDHRMFMAFALVSMLVPGGIPVLGVESLDVSFPTFLTEIARLGAKVGSL